MNRNSIVRSVMLALILPAAASAQTRTESVAANLCEVVASPNGYNGKVLSVEGILLPGEHSVLLYSPSCKPKESFDVGIQAVFPPEWASSPNGKQLHKLFNHRKSASVKLIGTFESGAADRYGPDVARFRFTISEISSVKKRHRAFTPSHEPESVGCLRRRATGGRGLCVVRMTTLEPGTTPGASAAG
jgi:hypothetical protein